MKIVYGSYLIKHKDQCGNCSFFVHGMTNYYMELNPSWETNSHSACQESPCLLSNLKVHYHVHKRSES